jgi:hypothetical protein
LTDPFNPFNVTPTSKNTLNNLNNNIVTYGEVHGKAKAKQIYDDAKRRGENAALTTVEKKDSSFNTKANIPSGKNATFWLTYEKQIARNKGFYSYSTKVRTFGEVTNFDLKINIKESRAIFEPKITLKGENIEAEDRDIVSASFKKKIENIDFDGDLKITYDVERPKLDGGDILIRFKSKKLINLFKVFLDSFHKN